jgi:hypothetical protein
VDCVCMYECLGLFIVMDFYILFHTCILFVEEIFTKMCVCVCTEIQSLYNYKQNKNTDAGRNRNFNKYIQRVLVSVRIYLHKI